jgi:DNA-binding MarR family transcriptional regulator
LSTKLTISPRSGYTLVDSRALRLTRLMGTFQERLVVWLINRLHDDGFEGLNAKQLTFMGQLDCRVNHASELARQIGVSRQAIHKSVQELTRMGWLETVPHPEFGNQKTIIFTDEGERMMSRARLHFAKLDEILQERFGDKALEALEDVLGTTIF